MERILTLGEPLIMIYHNKLHHYYLYKVAHKFTPPQYSDLVIFSKYRFLVIPKNWVSVAIKNLLLKQLQHKIKNAITVRTDCIIFA